MTEEFDPAQGRGGWTTRGKDNGSSYLYWSAEMDQNSLDGQHPERDLWHMCLHHGVKGLQRLLNEWQPDVHLKTDGVFGPTTSRAVKTFQTVNGLPNAGYVGRVTMEVLVSRLAADVATEKGIHPRWLYAFAAQESGFHPGAQGLENPPDMGIWQFNTEATTVEMGQAYRPRFACRKTAGRFKAGLEKYAGKGRRLQVDCAIAQHNWPVGADLWFENEDPPTAKIQEYVLTTRQWARDWTVL